MATSGLVLTLAEEAGARVLALAALAADSRLTLGPSVGARIAVVLQTPSFEEDAHAFEGLAAIPGVLHVDLVCAYDEACAAELSDEALGRPLPPSDLVSLRAPGSIR